MTHYQINAYSEPLAFFKPINLLIQIRRHPVLDQLAHFFRRFLPAHEAIELLHGDH